MGIDIVDIRRLRQIIDENGRFLSTFLPVGWLGELKNSQTAAGRVALFEATIKAFPIEHNKLIRETQFAYEGHAPKVVLPQKIANHYSIETSISHSSDFAIAICIMIKRP